MVHNMNKVERQLSQEDTLALLKKGDHGTLSVNGDDGYPYATPVNYIMVEDKLYIHSAPYGYKIECLEKSKTGPPPSSPRRLSPARSPPLLRAWL